MKQVLLIGNILFLRIDSKHTFIDKTPENTKYQTGSVNGNLFAGEIYTYTEIINKYPNIKQLDSLTDIMDYWSK